MKLCFLGDISLTGAFGENILEEKDLFSPEVTNLLEEQDYVIANLEGPELESMEPSPTSRIFHPPGSIAYLKDKNFNVWNLANNHIFDHGLSGFEYTKNKIANHKAHYFGAGSNLKKGSKVLYLTLDNTTVALIGIAHKEGMIASENSGGVFCKKNSILLMEQIQEAKSKADFVVLNYHGGEEYTLYPMPQRRKFLKKLTSTEVDMIICHHPHVVQGVEKINMVNIFYSLGNFIFDVKHHYFRSYTDIGMMLTIDLNREIYQYKVHYTGIDRTNGMVTLIDKDMARHHQKIADFSNYQKKWRKDAYRVFSEERINNRSSGSSVSTPYSRVLLGKLFKKSFYIALLSTLFSSNKRPILLGAVMYYLLRKFGMIND